MKDTLTTLTTAAAGIGGAQLVTVATPPASSALEVGVKCAIQLLIGIVTILPIFQRRKKRTNRP